ncbi:YozE family protein [Kurthia massiliensis]|uniref:YozE family protein n=1 Tax=Kurthia massiliensis TaxID=1033739 RepID=UPI0002899A0C|nr:YozE family protein [Kurthia massiliensis]
MRPSFYLYVLTFRGADDAYGTFAEAMFNDHSFPKQADTFEPLSLYIEQLASDDLNAVTFDDLWGMYEEKYLLEP